MSNVPVTVHASEFHMLGRAVAHEGKDLVVEGRWTQPIKAWVSLQGGEDENLVSIEEMTRNVDGTYRFRLSPSSSVGRSSA